MQIVFKGHYNSEEATESLLGILKLFNDRYGIRHFRGFQLSLNLLDSEGEDVELVDADTSKVFTTFEVEKKIANSHPYLTTPEINMIREPGWPNPQKPKLTLVVDNTVKKLSD